MGCLDREIANGGLACGWEDTLLCGKMYLPASMLEALYLRRMTPTQQIRLTAVSDSKLKSGGTVRSFSLNRVEEFSSALFTN